jgi:hypothetical protein
MSEDNPKDPTTWTPFMHDGRLLYPIASIGSCHGCVAFVPSGRLSLECTDMPPCRNRVFKLKSPEVIAEFTLQRLGVTNETQTI